MSTKPISSDLLSKYEAFSTLCADVMKVPEDTLQKLNKKDIWKGFQIKARAIEGEDFKPLSDKFKTQRELFRDIDDKMARVREKLFGSSKTKVEPWRRGCVVLNNRVGYGNESNNCSFNAYLIMCLLRPHLWHALSRVGTYCSQGGNIDLQRMQRVLDAFHDGTPQDLTIALSEYDAINHLIYKLNVICQLRNKNVDPAILRRFRFPIDAYRERIREKMEGFLAVSGGTATRKQTLAWGRLAMEQIVQEDLPLAIEQMKLDGGYIQHALEAPEEGSKQRAPVPSSVSQNMREAFHRLFTNYGPDGRVRHPISLSHFNNEDCHEIIDNVMGLDQRFRAFQGITQLPDGYFSVRKTTIFTPLPEEPVVDTSGTFTRLQHNSFRFEDTIEHEVILTLPDHEVSLEELLKRRAHSEETHTARYLNAQGLVQKYRCKESRTCIQGTPDQLTFQLVRFDGQLRKNSTPVRCNPYMILPAEITTTGTPVVYQLQSFVVHIGSSKSSGHYIGYGIVEGEWIEFNDALLRYVDNIVDVLDQRVSPSATPYILYYSKVPEGEQEAMLKVATFLAQKNSGRASVTHSTFRDQETLIARLGGLAEALKGKDNDQIRELYEAFIKEFPGCAQEMHHLLNLLTGLSKQACSQDPSRLKAAIGGDSIPTFLLKYHNLRLQRMDVELSLQAYNRFYLHLYSKEKGFEEIFNALPQSLREQIQNLVAPEEAPLKGETLREFILQRLDSTKDLSKIERDLQQQLHALDVQTHIQHLEDYAILLRTSKLNKDQLYAVLESFHLPITTVEHLLHGINIRRWGNPYKTSRERDLNVLSLKTNPKLLLQPNCKQGTETETTPSILESAILALK